METFCRNSHGSYLAVFDDRSNDEATRDVAGPLQCPYCKAHGWVPDRRRHSGTPIAPFIKVAIDRRDQRRRTDVIRSVVDQIVHNPDSRVTISDLKDLLNIPEGGARRIIDNLVKAGLVYEASPGVWARVWKLPSGQHGVRRRRDV
jgi:hypothetical protein